MCQTEARRWNEGRLMDGSKAVNNIVTINLNAKLACDAPQRTVTDAQWIPTF